jgi:hypothetical protein
VSGLPASVVVVPVVIAVMMVVVMLVALRLHAGRRARGGSVGVREPTGRLSHLLDQPVELGLEVLAEQQAPVDQPLQGGISAFRRIPRAD